MRSVDPHQAFPATTLSPFIFPSFFPPALTPSCLFAPSPFPAIGCRSLGWNSQVWTLEKNSGDCSRNWITCTCMQYETVGKLLWEICHISISYPWSSERADDLADALSRFKSLPPSTLCQEGQIDPLGYNMVKSGHVIFILQAIF